MRRKHILFICSWYPNRNNPTHGIFNRHFAEAAALYNEVSVLHVCSDRVPAAEIVVEEKNNISTAIVYYPKVVSGLPFISSLRKRRRYFQAGELGYQELVRRKGRPDLIQLNVILPAGLLALRLAKQNNLPFVINECWTGYAPEDGNYRGFLKRWFTRRIASRARRILPVSVYLKDLMLSHGIEGTYEVVPNVVDVERFHPVTSSPSEELRLLHISSLDDAQKNVKGLLRAFARASAQIPALRLTIIGDGEDRARLEQFAAGLGLGGVVQFKGSVLNERLVSEMNAHHALLMFSNYETLCLVIIEAFACGKPVITSDAGAIRHYMDPFLGITVRPGDEEALAGAILKFSGTRGSFDSAMIREFAVQNFSLEKIAIQLNTIYENVLTEK